MNTPTPPVPEKSPNKKGWLWAGGALLIIIAALAIWWWMDGDEDVTEQITATAAQTSLSAKECAGEFIDTHAHWDNEGYPAALSQRMAENGVGCSILFTGINTADPAESQFDQVEDLDPYIANFIPFFHVNPQQSSDISVDNITTAHTSRSDYFAGFGENAFYRDPLRQANLTDPNWQSVLEYLKQNDLWLMFHLRGTEQLADLRATLTAWPDNKFLLHGPELWAELPDLLREFNNLYFTLDTASLIQSTTGQMDATLMYPSNMDRSGFESAFPAQRAAILAQASSRWQPVVLAAPDRVMWGTDVSLDWHVDPTIYANLISFSRDFIATLPADVQSAFRRDNAARLFLN